MRKWIEVKEDKPLEPVYQNPIMKVVEPEFMDVETGEIKHFCRIEAKNWVQVCAITTDNKLILVNQYRFGTALSTWELPGGIIEDGEHVLSAGLRELVEETGYSFDMDTVKWHTYSVDSNPAYFNNKMNFLFVTGCVKTDEQKLDCDENCKPILIDMMDVGGLLGIGHMQLYGSQKFTHAYSNLALLYFLHYIKNT